MFLILILCFSFSLLKSFVSSSTDTLFSYPLCAEVVHITEYFGQLRLQRNRSVLRMFEFNMCKNENGDIERIVSLQGKGYFREKLMENLENIKINEKCGKKTQERLDSVNVL